MAYGGTASGATKRTRIPNRVRRLIASRRSLRPLPTVCFTLLAVVVCVLFVYPTVMVVAGSFRTSSPGFPGTWSSREYVDPEV